MQVEYHNWSDGKRPTIFMKSVLERMINKDLRCFSTEPNIWYVSEEAASALGETPHYCLFQNEGDCYLALLTVVLLLHLYCDISSLQFAATYPACKLLRK